MPVRSNLFVERHCPQGAGIQSSEGFDGSYASYGSGDGVDISTLRLALLSGSRSFRPSARCGSCRALTLLFNQIHWRFHVRLLAASLGGMICLAGVASSSSSLISPQSPPAVAPPSVTVPSPRFVVVLDAAHGGDDAGGKVGADGIAEKTVTLAVSVRLRSLLAARGFTVVTTREANVNLSSDARAAIANHAGFANASGTSTHTGAGACLSLHATDSGSGVHIFVSSLAPSQPSRFPAWKTAQSAYIPRSLKLAGTVNSAFEHSSVPGGDAGDANGGPIPATLARASIPGVDSMTCPAVAIEIAPIRGADRKVVTDVTDPQYQTQIVEALAAALLEWKTDTDTDSHPDGRQP